MHEPGLPFISGRTIGGGKRIFNILTGRVGTEADIENEALRTASNVLDKDVASIARTMFEVIGGNLPVSQQETIKESLANAEQNPGAIRIVTGTLIDEFLAQADAFSLSIEDREQFELLGELLKGGEAPTLDSSNTVTLPGGGSFTPGS